jgi:hypothetical protein
MPDQIVLPEARDDRCRGERKITTVMAGQLDTGELGRQSSIVIWAFPGLVAGSIGHNLESINSSISNFWNAMN